MSTIMSEHCLQNVSILKNVYGMNAVILIILWQITHKCVIDIYMLQIYRCMLVVQLEKTFLEYFSGKKIKECVLATLCGNFPVNKGLNKRHLCFSKSYAMSLIHIVYILNKVCCYCLNIKKKYVFVTYNVI